jgi:hypothetical protein
MITIAATATPSTAHVERSDFHLIHSEVIALPVVTG